MKPATRSMNRQQYLRRLANAHEQHAQHLDMCVKVLNEQITQFGHDEAMKYHAVRIQTFKSVHEEALKALEEEYQSELSD